MTWLLIGGPVQIVRLRVNVHVMLTKTQLSLILKDNALANDSYYEIRDNCQLVSCGYKQAGKSQVFVEHYLDKHHNCEYFAMFSDAPNSYIPLTITKNELT